MRSTHNGWRCCGAGNDCLVHSPAIVSIAGDQGLIWWLIAVFDLRYPAKRPLHTILALEPLRFALSVQIVQARDRETTVESLRNTIL